MAAEEQWPRSVRGFLLGIVILGLGAACFHATRSTVDPDELEHLHAAWLWGQGVQPYTGFFENHPPAYWLLLRPVIASVQGHDLYSLVTRARLLSWFMLVGSVAGSWWLGRALFGPKAAWCATALFALYCAFAESTFQIRPDTPAILLQVWGTVLVIDGMGAGTRRSELSWWRLLAGGLLLSAGTCVLTKVGFWLLCLLAVLAPLAIVRAVRGDRRMLAGLGVLAIGAALPPMVELIWVLAANDWGAFWYHNVQVNSHLAGSVLRSSEGLYQSCLTTFSRPSVSTPLAVLGVVWAFTLPRPGARVRAALAVGLTTASVLLIIVANGPWTQYQISFHLMLTILAGLGASVVLDQLPRRGQSVAAGLLLAVGLAWVWLLLLCQPWMLDERTPMRDSLGPLQAALDMSAPGDRYVTVQQWNPVFLMDADPRSFMRLLIFSDQQAWDDVSQLIRTRAPRFVIGIGSRVWMAEGRFAEIPPPTPSMLAVYRPLDEKGLVLVRG